MTNFSHILQLTTLLSQSFQENICFFFSLTRFALCLSKHSTNHMFLALPTSHAAFQSNFPHSNVSFSFFLTPAQKEISFYGFSCRKWNFFNFKLFALECLQIVLRSSQKNCIGSFFNYSKLLWSPTRSFKTFFIAADYMGTPYDFGWNSRTESVHYFTIREMPMHLRSIIIKC